MQSVEPVLENAIKTLQKVVDVRGMGKKWGPLLFNNYPWFDVVRVPSTAAESVKYLRIKYFINFNYILLFI